MEEETLKELYSCIKLLINFFVYLDVYLYILYKKNILNLTLKAKYAFS